MNQDYFKKSEQKCYKLLLDFNEKTHCFERIIRTEEKSTIDASGYSLNCKSEKRNFAIELKARNQCLLPNNSISGCSRDNRPYHCNDEYIEQHKLKSLLEETERGNEALYINFLQNATLVWNISKLTKRPSLSRTLKIRSLGYERTEECQRFMLPLADAAIYDTNGKLIKRPNSSSNAQR